ncbi:MAG: thioredoxin [Proteobacteria bacterium]|nr:thioredoxin [Pseudomonadota bacterium]
MVSDNVLAADNVLAVNDANFQQEVLDVSTPVLVDFTAGWCQPCRVVAPLVAQLATEYEGRVKITKLDIDESPTTAQRFGVRGVPTLMVFKDGQVVDQQVGAVPKTRIASMLDRSLS